MQYFDHPLQSMTMLTAMRLQSDWELSSRLWAAGWQVGHHLLQGRSNDHTGQLSGTHKPETERRCWGEHMVVVEGPGREKR